MCTPGMRKRWNAALGRLETGHLQGAGRPVSGRLGRDHRQPQRGRPLNTGGPALQLAGGTLGFLRLAPCGVKLREWDQPLGKSNFRSSAMAPLPTPAPRTPDARTSCSE